jgi:hypothetical protein
MLKVVGAIVVAIIFAMGVVKALELFRKQAETKEEKKD